MAIDAGGYGCPGFCDQLTGFYSRLGFLNKIRQLDLTELLPVSFIVGDLNDLKLINDVFGYSKGDSVIKEVAEVFRIKCRGDYIVARWGGDEFAAALPETSNHLSLKILENIKKGCSEVDIVPIRPTIAMGTATKESAGQDILEILKKAEAELYRNKLMEAKTSRNTIIASLVRQLGEKDYETEEHAWRMQDLAVQLGLELHLSDSDMEDLILAVTLHDIGKLAVPEQILMKPGKLNPEEWAIIKGHSERGYRIALSSNRFAHIAPIILSHHERWDGKGYPLGLKGEEIPLLSRIVAIVDSYDAMTHERPYKKAMSKKEARLEMLRSAGSQFDPELVKKFLKLDL